MMATSKRRTKSGPLGKVESMAPSRKRVEEVIKVLENQLFHVESVLLRIALNNIDDHDLNDLITNIPKWRKTNAFMGNPKSN